MPIERTKNPDEIMREWAFADSWDTLYRHVSDGRLYNGVVMGLGKIESKKVCIPIEFSDLRFRKPSFKQSMAVRDNTNLSREYFMHTGLTPRRGNPVRIKRYELLKMTMGGVGVLSDITVNTHSYIDNALSRFGRTSAFRESSFRKKVIPVATRFVTGKKILDGALITTDMLMRGPRPDNITDLIFFSLIFIPKVGWAIYAIYYIVDTYSYVTTGQRSLPHRAVEGALEAAEKASKTVETEVEKRYNALAQRWANFSRRLEHKVKNAILRSRSF